MKTTPPSTEPVERPEDHLKFDHERIPIPPWRLFPYEPGSMGWRMGCGEEYLFQFRRWYERLDHESRARYRRRRPAPLYWYWFYWNLDVGWFWFVAFLLLYLVTFPARLIAYAWYRIVRDGVP